MDQITTKDASGVTQSFATDQNGSAEHYPVNKLVYGALDTYVLVSDINGLPVQQVSGQTFTISNVFLTAMESEYSANACIPVGIIGNVTLGPGAATIGGVFKRPATSGGLAMHKAISAASTNANVIKPTPGQVAALQVFNLNASPRYLKLYNKTSSPAVGTDTPAKVILIPGNSVGTGVVLQWSDGIEFTAGIAYALTTGAPDNDTGPVGANEIIVNIDYK